MIEFKLPELGENITSGTVVKVSVSVGDSVKKDQTLLELETEKATVEVPSPAEGVIKEILIHSGDVVKVGQILIKIDEATGRAATEAAGKEAAAPQLQNAPSLKEKSPAYARKPSPSPALMTRGPSSERDSVTTTARSSVPFEEQPLPPTKSSAVNLTVPETEYIQSTARDVPAAPSVRRFAREIGIDITQVPGSGPGGRISLEDVKGYAKQMNLSRAALPSQTAAVAPKPLPDFSKWGAVERQPMSQIRQFSADHLTSCWQTIPHVTQHGKADITELEKLRQRYSTPNRKLTITPFLLKVMASALKVFPKLNASIDMERKEIIYKKYFHIGVAVDTEHGLLVPVIRNVDLKSILQIHAELGTMAERARQRKVSLEELKGGCMTLTNLGGIFGSSFTPIVNWPEVAILGVSRGSWEPVYENNQFIPRILLPLSLSYDHRLIDGADGARFLKWICEAIQQPFMMDLES